MRILIVSATAGEMASPTSDVRFSKETGVDLLVTGVGMVATAVRTTRALMQSSYDVALNVGVCGSFDALLPPGTVVHVVSDQFSEMGAEDGEAFLTLHQLGLLDGAEPPFTRGCLLNASPPDNAALKRLPAVRGITVNTVHGDSRSIAAVATRLDPQVESMEGAAFMYACLEHGVPFAQVRAVSNIVERRNRSAWKMADAIENLHHAVLAIVETL